MRWGLSFAGVLVLTSVAHAEPTAVVVPPPPPVVRPVDPAAFVAKRQTTFAVLGGWSLVSMGVGAGLALGGPNDFERFFGIQALAWGAVNLGFTIFGQASSRPDLFSGPDAQTLVRDNQKSLSKAFWINALLDVGYVIAGTLIWNLGGTDAVRGTGAGIVAQGGFLFGFDTLGYMLFR
jgi:hypothetical protein